MKKFSLTPLKHKIPEVIISRKNAGYVPVVILEGSNAELIKGFYVNKTPRSIEIGFWFFPQYLMEVDSMLGWTFRLVPPNHVHSFYSIEELTNEEIIRHLTWMIEINKNRLNKVNTTTELRDFILDERKGELLGAKNPCNMALLHYVLGHNDDALEAITIGLNENSIEFNYYGVIKTFYDLLIKQNYKALNKFVEELRQATVAKGESLNLYKSIK